MQSADASQLVGKYVEGVAIGPDTRAVKGTVFAWTSADAPIYLILYVKEIGGRLWPVKANSVKIEE